MTQIVLEIPQNQDLDFLLSLLRRLNFRVVAQREMAPDAAKSDAFSMNDFQEAMSMTDEDMDLTFGEDYLQTKNWQPSHA